MRTELLYDGVHPGPLYSPRDITLRKFLAKKKHADSNKLMVQSAAAVQDVEALKKAFKNYQDTLWYEEITKNRDEEMLKYYHEHVKHMRPEIYAGEDGSPTVRGLP